LLHNKQRERVRCSSLVDWPVCSRLEHATQWWERAQCGPTRPPQRSIPPRHAQNHALLADPTGRVSSNTPARPPASAAPRIKRPDRELQRPSAATGVGRPMATTTSSLPQHPYRICLLSFDRGIFLTEGFQANDRLPKGPPPPPLGLLDGAARLPDQNGMSSIPAPYSSRRIPGTSSILDPAAHRGD
jgi:hypothetical protein